MKRWLSMLVLVISASSGSWALGQVATSPPTQAAEGTLLPSSPAANRFDGPTDGSHDSFIARWRQSLNTLSCVFIRAQRAMTPSSGRLQSDSESPVEILAARVKVDEGNAQNRINAIRYLATRDCQYWHEAEDVLLAALRCDRNEGVRFEAARALAAGGGKSQRTLSSLNMIVNGSDEDGNPVEKSERIKAIAAQALRRSTTEQFAVAYLPPPTTTMPALTIAMPPTLPALRYSAALEQAEQRRMGEGGSDQELRNWAARVGTVAPRPRRGLWGLIQDARSRQVPPPAPRPESTPPPPPPILRLIPVAD